MITCVKGICYLMTFIRVFVCVSQFLKGSNRLIMRGKKIKLPYCPVYKPRLSDANLGSENIPRPIHRVGNVNH